jgi:hypothetical protein
MSRPVKSLDALELRDFDDVPIWRTTMGDYETVEPMPGKRSVDAGDAELWVRVRGILADGTEYPGVAMAESSPPTLLLPSFLVGTEWITVTMPPAPAFVLEKDGPDPFARRLGRTLAQVFPVEIRSEVLSSESGQVLTSSLEINRKSSLRA